MRIIDGKTDENSFFPALNDSRICEGEDSNHALGDLAVGANLNQNAGNSMDIAPDVFDAISGLGQLSNSPFKDLPRRDNSSNRGEKKKSFFATVMGDSKE